MLLVSKTCGSNLTLSSTEDIILIFKQVHTLPRINCPKIALHINFSDLRTFIYDFSVGSGDDNSDDFGNMRFQLNTIFYRRHYLYFLNYMMAILRGSYSPQNCHFHLIGFLPFFIHDMFCFRNITSLLKITLLFSGLNNL